MRLRINKNWNVLLILIVCGPLLACTCIGKFNVKEAFKKNDQIFYGEVIRISNLDIQPSKRLDLLDTISFKVATIKIEEIFKGRFRSDTIEVKTGLGNGDCGVNFKLGHKFLVYGSFIKSNSECNLFTSICQGTKNGEISKEISLLRTKRQFWK